LAGAERSDPSKSALARPPSAIRSAVQPCRLSLARARSRLPSVSAAALARTKRSLVEGDFAQRNLLQAFRQCSLWGKLDAECLERMLVAGGGRAENRMDGWKLSARCLKGLQRDGLRWLVWRLAGCWACFWARAASSARARSGRAPVRRRGS
jgi:hypothetical protein